MWRKDGKLTKIDAWLSSDLKLKMKSHKKHINIQYQGQNQEGQGTNSDPVREQQRCQKNII